MVSCGRMMSQAVRPVTESRRTSKNDELVQVCKEEWGQRVRENQPPASRRSPRESG